MCVKVICYPAKAWTPKLLLRFVTITLLLRNYVTLRSGPDAYYGSAPTPLRSPAAGAIAWPRVIKIFGQYVHFLL